MSRIQQIVIAAFAVGVIVLGSLMILQRVPAQPTVEEAIFTPLNTPVVQTSPMSKQYQNPPLLTIDKTASYTAVLKTSKGTLRVLLFANETPVTVNNFVFLANDHYYDNTPFHRILSGFMIQGGDPTGTGMGNPGYRFADEPITRSYTRGTIAMANSGPNTNGSQFFIMHEDYQLPKQYVIFGTIDLADTESLATLDAIAATPVADNGRGEASEPIETVTLETVSIITQ